MFAMLLCTTLFVESNAQLAKLRNFEASVAKKIETGMSTAEVKTILGRPKAIESGFPDSRESIVDSLPDQRGQLNNSTWFYFYNPISIDVDKYVVNAFSVSKEMFEAYNDKDTVYFHNDSMIFPSQVESYRSLRDPGLHSVLKSKDQEFTSIRKVRRTFLPILCVVFDRGTLAVALTKMYFKTVY